MVVALTHTLSLVSHRYLHSRSLLGVSQKQSGESGRPHLFVFDLFAKYCGVRPSGAIANALDWHRNFVIQCPYPVRILCYAIKMLN